MFDTAEHPGLLFVWATLLPLAAFTLLLLAGALRNYLRPRRSEGGITDTLFQMLGGEVTGVGPAWVATAAIMFACVLCVVGFVQFLTEHHHMHDQVAANQQQIKKINDQERARAQAPQEKKDEPKEDAEPDENPKVAELSKKNHELEEDFEHRWSDSITWASLTSKGLRDPDHGTRLTLGYRIDHLAAIMFVMVTFVASLIHLFSIGYMREELQRTVEDHEVHTPPSPPSEGGAAGGGHLRRRGRFGRFFLFMSLFCFSMLNL